MIEAFHMVSFLSILLILIIVHASQALIPNAVGRFPFLMPNVHPYRPELYLCTPIRIDYTNSYFIVGFEPNATMNTAHHMLLYGCGAPGSEKPVWNCGEMASSDEDYVHEVASPCGQGAHSQIIYAWARDAPKLELPEGVGFKVGKDSPIQYLVMQVHYAHIHKFRDGSTDDSGIFLHYTKQPLHKQAGVLLLGTGGLVPPMSVEKMETSCTIDEDKLIHPFAFRVHTHSLGKVVSGWRVRDGKWTLLGRRDPLKPQMFYPLNNTEPIRTGDTVAARCTMLSNRKRITFIGATNEDEMCNFYLMYYVDSGEPLMQKYCFGYGPPKYYWMKDENLQNIPDEEASQLDE
ncbi:peptidylglycine alpha-hydroxylating monooxygenase [Contarinia nasturtii]|uniref:peptidylglycine alpha-hydroxylating monooxygenase n=1 Tax=Contarinia nasturtii TaxID=265458 RepID=UPI0012D4887B|nr:peptidylglycine alpha-hydroxylating monooxygenase [Contarinia nasturtii]XP_031638053.1 peptidylglycine alpha-hydroxylating monooxygenase [Contarinia nasturtii]XP_031638059.1 peptidylglycine alpha-hydroxylating monooxygenase [Contarinia nasturtii]XP_031638067.1 peptidylglycine alpha-hydroxylating monooxygenase [Contarinia nasturtii]